MSDHTPGPWSARLNPMKLRYDIDAAGWRTCARVYLNEDPDLSRQGHANARLIAAAPELLEALTELVICQESDYGHVWLSNPGGYGAYCVKCTAVRRDNLRALAAIAKARGEAVPA